ncbi:MAG: carboxypeptidase-like regulatory domain-containing protein, partial [Lutibacter sp.]|nr:carboxypeptidase-like regulatory domain-containing protein [Lutibacter sp.]
MKKVALVFLALLFSTLSNAQNFEKLWDEVERFEIKNLPKSALQIVETIYTKAKKENNSNEIIKSLIYKSKFALTLEENAQLSIINNFKKEISENSFPTKNILESVLADLYLQYFQQNRWKFYNRTNTAEKVDVADFRTWDLQTLFEEIQLHYNNSLNNSLEAQLTNLTNFDSLLNLGANSKTFRPTLYDFLANRALDFYKDEEQNLTRPAYKFEISNPILLKNNTEFTSEIITSKDSISNHLQALKIYRNLTLFHLKDTNPTALINLTLERLDFVKNNAVFQDKNDIYLTTLQQLKNEFQKNEASTEIDFEIATLYNEAANLYQPKTETVNQFKRKEALGICEKAIQKFPKSSGAKKCENLKNQILHKNIAITTEKHLPISTNGRLLITYKNIEKVFITAFEISDNEQDKFNKIYNDSTRVAFIKNLKPIKKWQATLKNEGDFQEHSTEVLIPALNQGNYLVVATTENEGVSAGKTYAYSLTQITNLVMIENNSNGNYLYQVVNRNNGKPIEGALVNLKNYDTGRYNSPINKNFKTDKNGEFSYKTNKTHRNIIATVKYGEDAASFGNYYIQEERSRNTIDDRITVKSFIFTDRSIYRPGQTVYFKGIFLKKQGETTEVLTEEYVEISLNNPNGELVKKYDLKLNEFGAVSGEFILPTTGLTGSYIITTNKSSQHSSSFYNSRNLNFNYSNNTISVEEYKRPKFETSFKPVTETFKLNDSVTVTGNATAFAGSTISNAKVVYRVKRTAIFPRWYGWGRSNFYRSEELEITNGETTTNNDGSYKITFKAIPDLKVSKESLPTFNYTISADVTDINGETRSTETTVKVGYHTLEASIAIASKIDKAAKENSFSINTTNLNNEFVPTKGTLKIYKLKSPKNPLRNRPWEAPDYQNFTKVEFEKLFPHDPYTSDENTVANWDLGEVVFEKNFNTESSKKIELDNLKKWTSGNYKIILESKDNFNQNVKDEQLFELFGENEKTIADNKLFIITTDKDAYKPTDFVNVSVSSASKDLTVMVSIEKQRVIVSSHYIHLSNETKIVKIPVNTDDLGGFAIKYHFVNYNSFQNGVLPISVPYPDTKLQIETLTFRDKLQPGSEQTWSFKITGKDNEKIASEVLASMYDASLDEFKSHNWQFNPIQRPIYYSYQNTNANNSFGNINFIVNNQNNYNYNSTSQSYDALNWFGFSFNNNYWEKQQYLTSIRKPINLENHYDATKEVGFIYGTVYDSDNLPLPGVTILVKGTTKGAQTDFDGNYTIKATKGDKLVFSFIGMNTTEIKIDKNNIISIQLTESGAALDEVVVVGYGKMKRSAMVGAVPGVEMEMKAEADDVLIRGANSTDATQKPLYIVDGVIFEEDPNLNADEIISIDVLKDAASTAIYGAKGANGVIIITTKNGTKNELDTVKARTNFQETAFFYPHLTTDKNGEISFNFTMPEALTRWKLQLLAHTKTANSAVKSLTTVTQKELMVLPNPPRFLREGDEIIFSSKISNLSD